MQVGNRVRILESFDPEKIRNAQLKYCGLIGQKGRIIREGNDCDSLAKLYGVRFDYIDDFDYIAEFGGSPVFWMKPEWLEVIDEE